jgi:phosphatidylserine/phosphatidylglycerophosphate/cardiolipin synthase-like enzyme
MFFRRAVVVVAIAVIAAGFEVPAQAGRYTPGGGTTFNSPVGGPTRQDKIFDKLIRSIRSTPRGHDIRIMSWNIQSQGAVDALLRAQRRGVRVRVLMSRSNAAAIDNRSWARLKKGLHRGNAHRREARHSWGRLCSASCRGRTGAAHAKYFLFSRSGRARQVVIHGSANLTAASTENQWNDIYTTINRERPYKFYVRIFSQMARDRPVRSPYAAWSKGGDRYLFFPGGSHPDPVMGLLNKVRCHGATNTRSHKTRVRIAPDVLREERGMRLGRKVWELWQNGCDVRIGYTVMGVDIGRMLRRPGQRGRGVPMRHLVQDVNGDGMFDRYFHLKAMTLVGNVGGDRSNHVVLNGSSNWSRRGFVSDENVGVYWRKNLTQRYAEHFDYWYNWPGFIQSRRYGMSARMTEEAGQDGRLVDGLLFGTAPINGVDPYANVDMD